MIGRRIQNYKVVSLIGRGGMGEVYKAFDVKLERYAALKILSLNTTHNSTFIERFKREARNQAKLMHPNIVSVYGFVEEKDVLGIAMEYIEGDTIESIIQVRGRIEFSYALELMEQILTGIDFAHQHGFIHRDLKPSNIILDLNGNPKIMDFGISKSIDELKSITQHNARPGTLLYMSPEQLSGNLITIKSDLYSIAITFYEMLTGAHPYNSQTIYEIIESHVNRVPSKISQQIPSIPSSVDEIILSAMSKSSLHNYTSAIEFKSAIVQLKQNYSYTPVFEESPEIHSDNDFNALPKKSSKGFQTISNILLFLIFIGLGVIVFNVVKSIIIEQQNNKDPNSLSYSQDYSKNPNYLQESEWDLVQSESVSNLNTITFLDDYKGFIAGDSGTLLQTSDGGVQWKAFKTKYNNNLYSSAYIDNKVFISGSEGSVFYLTPNSTELKKIILKTSEALFKIYFINSHTGFIVGSNGLIFKSADGGLSWRKIQSGTNANLFSVSFSDEKNGIIVGWGGTILKTSDFGESWEKYKSDLKTYLKDVAFVNQFLGLIVGGEGKILRTENGGDNWEEIKIDSDAGLYKINFDTNGEGIILSNRGEIFFSNDAGKTWRKKNVGQPIILNDIKQLNSGNFIIACNSGNIFKSKVHTSK
ncbi:MAG TPA: hypothetical protein DHV28_18120 [Ignavibacteriales bacterium]|nr:hypothetical protein [Ignavibacteriales bacterium]